MGFWADEPRALPWAGMNDALGVSNLALPLDLGSILLSKNSVLRPRERADIPVRFGVD